MYKRMQWRNLVVVVAEPVWPHSVDRREGGLTREVLEPAANMQQKVGDQVSGELLVAKHNGGTRVVLCRA